LINRHDLSKFVDWCSILKQKDDKQSQLEVLVVNFICKSSSNQSADILKNQVFPLLKKYAESSFPDVRSAFCEQIHFYLQAINEVKVPKSKYFDKDLKAFFSLYKKLTTDSGAQLSLFKNCGKILFELSQHSESKYAKDVYKLVEDTLIAFKGSKSFDS